MRTKTGELKKVSTLFDKYKNTLVAPEATVINGFIEVVEDVLSFKLKKSHISYNPNTKTLSITGQAAIRTEVKIHQEEILAHMKGRFGAKNTPKTIL